MNTRSVRALLLIVAVALVASACGSASVAKTAGAAAATATSASATAAASSGSPTLSGGTAATGPFCDQLKASQGTLATQTSQYAKAVESGNFAGIKSTLAAFFHKAEGQLATVESTMSGAPANVQSALTTVNQTYTRMVSAVDSSTSLTQLSAAFIALDKNPSLKPALATLTAYGESQCGR